MHSAMEQDCYLHWPCSANFTHITELWNFPWYAWARKMELRKSHNVLKLGVMMQFTMKRITVWNGHTRLMFVFCDLGRLRVLPLSERLVGIRKKVTCKWRRVYRFVSLVSIQHSPFYFIPVLGSIRSPTISVIWTITKKIRLERGVHSGGKL